MTNKINLKKQQILWFQSSVGEPQMAQITAGKVWVTIEGEQKDFIVSQGEYLPPSDQKILIEALSEQVVIDMIELTL